MPTPQPLDVSKYGEISLPERILLGPGPSMIDPRVLRVMASPAIGYMDPGFFDLLGGVQELLRYLFQTENRLTLPMSGTGSAAMETVIANLVEPGDGVLVLGGGYFALRMADMAARHGGEVNTITRPWGQVFTADDVETALKARPTRVVCLVHGETSTGTLQPVPEIAAVAHRYGALLIVDTVASLGGAPFQTDAWDVDACYTGSQKCLSTPSGLGPVTLGPRAEEKLAVRRSPVHSWYLDLNLVRKYWEDRVYHHTVPATANYALYESLRLIAAEGLEAGWQRHRCCAEMLYEGLASLGLECHVAPADRLPTLTTVRVPAGVDEARVRKELMDGYNIEIAGGLGELKGKVWRVGLMGYSARPENVALLIEALRRILR